LIDIVGQFGYNAGMNKGLQKVYKEIHSSYELINHILTFGMDVICRKRAAGMAAQQHGENWLDICCGTGEMTANLMRLKNKHVNLFGADFSKPMIDRAKRKKANKKAFFLINEAEHLPFRDNFFDLITISFATRNLNSSETLLIKRLREFYRVLKPGGIFVNLETSQPQNKFIKKLTHLYVKITVQKLGTFISGNKAGYSYLAASIPRFYNADQLRKILLKSGFGNVSYRSNFFGIIAIHKAQK
jgi:demethylmenaquinone methyltransferase/2-methoxy-6-polyprenyl-1,4-benzoquinol methylase